MPFIVRQYLIDKLKEHNLECAFKDEGDRIIIFVRNEIFEIEYHGNDEEGYSIFDVSFETTYPCYSVLFYFEKIIEEILCEYTRLSKYIKLKRNK